ncbi:hypothetical protein CLUG_03837 [Clavispora lusitaniae ATCC 42720]|uniref:Uncharacterized protein n=1 Tax=Clavispora lusitaniae (strain ATCC 42720) TaxID=306902 RepID=C4Y6Q3_CLAL4|nr:uncharacterized protein CLUG_03837 [Clavispora lusitaniae ATCC 42720]EEQ39709.1 hypothetical protein CLUG_03837 [Clavispora lusitaniae ATCC 42720]
MLRGKSFEYSWNRKLSHCLSDLRVASKRVGILGLQVLVRLLLPFPVHRDWWSWSHGSDGSEQTNTCNQTSDGTPENLRLVARSVQRLSWTPFTEGNVVCGFLFGRGQFLPWQLHSSLQFLYQGSLVLFWQGLPSGFQLVDVCVRQRLWGSFGHGRVKTDCSDNGLAKHVVSFQW